MREVEGVWSEKVEGSACGVREVKGLCMGGREGTREN